MTTLTTRPTIDERVEALPWPELHDRLDEHGFALTPTLLSATECRDLLKLYEEDRFRSTVTMARHRFGDGEYKYFDHPLPETIAELRCAFYPQLAKAANRWAQRLDENADYPDQLDEFLERCHAAGQHRPTPLMLRYGPGDWNALHQDLYGEVAFPFQLVTVLDRPHEDFEGGEFVLLEQRPRAQSRAHVVQLLRGAFLIFATRQRPVQGSRGFYRGAMRHGVSTVHSGARTTLGIIFHDAN
jgi:hypothetical protein